MSKLKKITVSVVMLFAGLAFTACSDDEPDTLMDPSVMLGQDLVASNYSFIWNGNPYYRYDDMTARFSTMQGEQGKMMMSIKGVIPERDDSARIDVQLPVDVVSHSGKIEYSGETRQEAYTLKVNGVYLTSDSAHFFKLKCEYAETVK